MTTHRCIGWGLLGAVLGLAAVAWGQEPGPLLSDPGPLLSDPGQDLLIQLASELGWPGIAAALIAWLARKGPPTLRVEHAWAPDTEQSNALRDLAVKVAALEQRGAG